MATRWQLAAFALYFMPIALTITFLSSASVADAATFAAKPLSVVRVATGFEFTEGPVPDQDGRIWFTDLQGRWTEHETSEIWRFDPTTGESELQYSDANGANGLAIDNQGRLIAAEGFANRLTRRDGDEIEVLADTWNGIPLNSPNDIAIDKHGGIYFTDPPYFDDQQPAAVYYLSAGGDLNQVITGLRYPNGIGLSPDESTLYVVDSDSESDPNPDRQILRYDLPTPGEPTNGQGFLDYFADGITVDRFGNIYAAAWLGVAAWTPDGELLFYIGNPQPESANVTLGDSFGAYPNSMYITANKSLYRVDIEPRNKGDLDLDGELSLTDVDTLTELLKTTNPSIRFDLNGDGNVSDKDRSYWVKDLKNTWFGDADLNGEFNSSDMVQVFVAGMYETGEENGWSEGDWNGDGFFSSSDMVTAFVDGGYEKGLRTDALAVPEPSTLLTLVFAAVLLLLPRANRASRLLLVLLMLTPAVLARADILDWRTGEVIPGTEGIELGPGVQLDGMDLGWADLSNMDLTRAVFEGSNLADSRFAGSNLTGVRLGSPLTNADLTGAIVNGAIIPGSPSSGITKEQFYSTASYQAKNLQGILFLGDFAGWNFGGQDLTNAGFGLRALLMDANFTDAIITGVFFDGFHGARLSKEQLYSTKSYQDGDLRRLQDTEAYFSDMDLSDKNLTNAILYGAMFENTNLTHANLTNADLRYSTLTNANLRGASLINTSLVGAGVASAVFDSTTVYSEWTEFPADFDPDQAGLTLVVPPDGDYDASGYLDAPDIDMVATIERDLDWFSWREWLSGIFDDHRSWVKTLAYTWYGDATLDGEFNSSDMVQVFAAGKYEKEAIVNQKGEILIPVSWAEGDWNGDGVFDSSDMVTAFVDGGYAKGPRRTDAVAVPEPGGWLLLMLATGLLVAWRCRF